jgi:two-component system sensor histidine kinase DesK
VQLAAMAAIGLNVLLPLIELGRIVLYPTTYGLSGSSLAALLATLATVPLHVRHISSALRGGRPAGAAWSLAALVAVNAVAVLVVGPGWLMNFALLAVSVLIIVPAPWSMPLFVAVVLAAGLLAGDAPEWPGAYLVFSVGWRSVTLFVVVWLVAAFRQLDAARRELRDRAVVRERLRMQAELRSGLDAALDKIVSHAEVAGCDRAAAPGALRLLIEEARATLVQARRLIAGYRDTTVRAELEAALTLLAAAGIQARVAVANDRALDAVDARSQSVLRAIVVRVLAEEPLSRCVIRVDWNHGELMASVLAEDDATDSEA